MMVAQVIIAGIVAFLSLFIPGFLIALALLKKTDLNMFEIGVIGFIFGLILPATMTWAESYFMKQIHFFSFSLGLFELNAIVLAVIGFLLCIQQGVITSSTFKFSRAEEAEKERPEIIKQTHNNIIELRHELNEFKGAQNIITKHIEEEASLKEKQINELKNISGLSIEEKQKILELHKKEDEQLMQMHINEEEMLLQDFKNKKAGEVKNRSLYKYAFAILFAIMLIVFITRIIGIGKSSTYFEFDPYFDMLNTQSILIYGYQVLYSPSAWPLAPQGTILRIQPLIPYLEAYWYSLMNVFTHYSSFNTTLMSNVSSVYPPLTAALLVFVIFLLIYKQYDEWIGLISAGLIASIPVLFTTFVAGEQLLEPWGIFSLFFFFATYMLAIKNMKSNRLAILAGLAFVSTFLGAHYYTVDAGVLTLYILIQGIINVLRRDFDINFYKMNAIVITIIAIFLAIYHPYHATLTGRIPSVFGIPITVSGPLFALLIIAVLEYVPKFLHKNKIIFKKLDFKSYFMFIAVICLILVLLILFTKLGNPIKSYLTLSKHFTTPSTPLFMTVQEFIPTGFKFNFASNGLGLIAIGISNFSLLFYAVIFSTIILILLSIWIRNDKIGILYLAIFIPLLFAGLSEVKYLPHLAVAYVMLIGILIGEVLLLKSNNYSLKFDKNTDIKKSLEHVYSVNKEFAIAVLSLALFLISSILSIAFLLYAYISQSIVTDKSKKNIFLALIIIFIAIELVSVFAFRTFVYGESQTLVNAVQAISVHYANPANECNIFQKTGNIAGSDAFCNQVPGYWLNATQWMKQNVGPYGPRVLSWWDYGDWINWFGNSNAVLRGDNSIPKEDYATAANYVLGPKYGYDETALANFMNTNQTRYIVFDQGLIPKWGALDFLACININATSKAFAISQGARQGVPYALGQSQCELSHDPEYALLPLSAIAGNATSQDINNYCSFSTSQNLYIKAYLVANNTLLNSTACVSANPNQNGAMQLYTPQGAKMNAFVSVADPQITYQGEIAIQGANYISLLVIYTPNGPNDTVTDAPTEFYNSNFYKGFFYGKLNGFTQVFPENASNLTGINLVNYVLPLRILELNNFTGQLPTVPVKYPWITNNMSMP